MESCGDVEISRAVERIRGAVGSWLAVTLLISNDKPNCIEPQTASQAELEEFDMKEVCGFFARTAESMKAGTKKLDDKMQPLQKSRSAAPW